MSKVKKNELDFRVLGNVVVPNSRITLSRTQPGDAMIALHGMDGKESAAYRWSQADGLGFELELPDTVRSGVYVIRLVQDGRKLSRKLVVR